MKSEPFVGGFESRVSRHRRLRRTPRRRRAFPRRERRARAVAAEKHIVLHPLARKRQRGRPRAVGGAETVRGGGVGVGNDGARELGERRRHLTPFGLVLSLENIAEVRVILAVVLGEESVETELRVVSGHGDAKLGLRLAIFPSRRRRRRFVVFPLVARGGGDGEAWSERARRLGLWVGVGPVAADVRLARDGVVSRTAPRARRLGACVGCVAAPRARARGRRCWQPRATRACFSARGRPGSSRG